MVEGVWQFALAHAKWRDDVGMDKLVQDSQFEACALHPPVPGVLAVVSPCVAWLNATEMCGLLPAAPSPSGPVLWVAMPSVADDVDGVQPSQTVLALMHHLATACGWANARLGVGVWQQAQVVLDLSESDDSVGAACVSMVVRDIGLPRLYAMANQFVSSTGQAARPRPSRLVLDHYPACFHRIVIIAPPHLAKQDRADGRGMLRALPAAWRFVSGLAKAIPMADTLASAVLLDTDTRGIMHVTRPTLLQQEWLRKMRVVAHDCTCLV